MDNNFVEAAEAAQEQLVENTVALLAKKAIPSTDLAPHEYKVYECNECGEDLPTFRMQKGLTVCTSCQSNIEKGRSALSKSLR